MSAKEWIASIGDTEHEIRVAVDPNGRTVTLSRGSERVVVDALEVAPGSYSILLHGRSFIVDLDRRGGDLVACSSAYQADVALDDARRRRLAAAIGGTQHEGQGEIIKAPIAGKVIKLFVEIGEAVQVGSRVIVLEAMKMENEIKAARAGIVESIHVQPGQSVETRERLVTISAS